MPIIKSAIKRSKQANKRRDRNIETKKAIKSATKAFLADPSAETLAKAQSELDKAVKKGLLKKNTVSRRKMRLSRIAKEAGVKPAAKATAKAPAKAAAKPAAKTKVSEKLAAKKAPAKAATKTNTKAKTPAKK